MCNCKRKIKVILEGKHIPSHFWKLKSGIQEAGFFFFHKLHLPTPTHTRPDGHHQLFVRSDMFPCKIQDWLYTLVWVIFTSWTLNMLPAEPRELEYYTLVVSGKYCSPGLTSPVSGSVLIQKPISPLCLVPVNSYFLQPIWFSQRLPISQLELSKTGPILKPCSRTLLQTIGPSCFDLIKID